MGSFARPDGGAAVPWQPATRKLEALSALRDQAALADDGPFTEDKAVTVILPAYNESAALANVLDSLFTVLDGQCEIIVVDDGSTDDTAAIASRYPCRVLRHERNRGKGAAVQTAVREAQGTSLIVMDADATYPVEAVPGIIALLKEYDLVRCTRLTGKDNMPVTNRFGNWLFDTILRIVHDLEGQDHLSGFYGVRRAALATLQLEANGFDLEAEIGIKARAHGWRIGSLGISYNARIGAKKLRPWRDGWTILRRLLALALVYNPLLMFVTPGILLWIVAGVFMLVLSRGPVTTPFVGLDVHSFLVAALAMPVGFQCVVFGVAASLYGVDCGIPPRPWLRRLSSPPVRFGAAAIGLLLCGLGFAAALILFLRWTMAGAGPFTEIQPLVLSLVSMLWGTQIVVAALFLSIFAGRIYGAKDA